MSRSNNSTALNMFIISSINMPVNIFIEDPDEVKVPVLRYFAVSLLCEQMQAGIDWMEVSLIANLSKIR